jgi:hypothetical protein
VAAAYGLAFLTGRRHLAAPPPEPADSTPAQVEAVPV